MGKRIQKRPDIGRRLIEIRERLTPPPGKKKFTQEDLAALWGADQSTLKTYELGRVPNAFVLMQYAELGKTTVDWILTGRQTETEIVGDRVSEARHFWTVELPPVVSLLTERVERQANLLRRLGTDLPKLTEARELHQDVERAKAGLSTDEQKRFDKLLRKTEKGTPVPSSAREAETTRHGQGRRKVR